MMEYEGEDENQHMEEGYDEVVDPMEMDDIPVTQEDAWAVIR
jgi:hypothetical protein